MNQLLLWIKVQSKNFIKSKNIEEKVTIICITHDHELIKISDKVINIKKLIVFSLFYYNYNV